MATSRLRARREARGLSQIELAARALLSRQSVGAIESGRAVPAVDVALRLAGALGCRVEDLFGPEPTAPRVEARLVGAAHAGRVALAHLGGRWIAHGLGPDVVASAADGLIDARGRVEALRPLREAEDNVVVMGCAPALGLLASRLDGQRGPGRYVWIPRSSTAALEALRGEQVHVAGVHLVDARTGEANVPDVRRMRPREGISLVTLARWEVGLVVSAARAGVIRGVADLGRPGLRFVGRELGAGARRVFERAVRAAGLPASVGARPALVAAGHLEVARAVALGAADVGVATREAAQALGVAFVPLATERYDLAIPTRALGDARVATLLDALTSAPVRRELDALGYDTAPAGQRVADVEAA